MTNGIPDRMSQQPERDQVATLLKHLLDVKRMRGAAQELRALPREPVLVIVRELADDQDEDVRTGAMRTLAGLEPVRAVEWLIPYLDHDRTERRWYACFLLRIIGDARSVEPLVRVALHDPNSDVRFTAVTALEETGDRRAVLALQHIQQHDQGTDYEGRRIDISAAAAIAAIQARAEQHAHE